MRRLLALGIVACLALTAGCASVPPPSGRSESSALADIADTRLGRSVAPHAAANPGRSGIHAMPDGYDAFAARVACSPPPRSARSFNFDQRSARLNTELGVVVDSRAGAAELAAFFDDELPALAYEVRLAAVGEGLIWIERDASGRELRYDVDPDTPWTKRFGVGFLSGLPIDWLLKRAAGAMFMRRAGAVRFRRSWRRTSARTRPAR